ncbi:MAG: hypothetical protein J7K20_00045 [Thermodesulfobacterium sp.]|nr:hypothetical protein [Thermodesulfobacterium sp.]
MKVYNMSLEEIKREGIRILTKNLGIVGMIRFFQQIDKGWGDYTKEREKWLGNPSLEEIYKEIKKLKENI